VVVFSNRSFDTLRGNGGGDCFCRLYKFKFKINFESNLGGTFGVLGARLHQFLRVAILIGCFRVKITTIVSGFHCKTQ
jgi:hypothetical protein